MEPYFRFLIYHSKLYFLLDFILLQDFPLSL